MSVKFSIFCNQLIIYFLILILILQPIAYATLDVDTDRSPQVNFRHSDNGITVIDIANPTDQGLSDNYFRAYNVPDSGIIINNSVTPGQVSALGGIIMPNMNLVDGNGPASTIVFEVTGTGPSRLTGMTELHGDSATFILSNPNGIQINGGAFYNTPRATLTTGEILRDAVGRVTGVSVQNGTISVGERGFTTQTADTDFKVNAVDLLSRSLELHGAVYAPDITVITGRNHLDYTDIAGAIIPLAPDDAGKPQFAIDSSHLGGMYANAIRFVSTEHGVGVRFRSDSVAQTQLYIDAAGVVRVDNGNLISRDGLDIHATALDNDGVILAKTVGVTIADALTNTGSVISTGDTHIQAQTVANQPGGVLQAAGTLAITADQIQNTGAVTTVWADYDATELTWKNRDTGEIIDLPETARTWREVTEYGTGEVHLYDYVDNQWVHRDTGDLLDTQAGRLVLYDNHWFDPQTHRVYTAGGEIDAYTTLADTRIYYASDVIYTADAIELLDSYNPAVIHSGGDLTLTGDVVNTAGEIRSLSDSRIIGQVANIDRPFEQRVSSQSRVWDQTGTSQVQTGRITVRWEDSWYQCGWLNCGWKSRWHSRLDPVYRYDPIYSWRSSTQAGASISRSKQAAIVTANATGLTQAMPTGLQKLFTTSGSSADYIFETNPLFTTIDGYVRRVTGSDYFINLYNSRDAGFKRLGDAVYEYVLLSRQYQDIYGTDLNTNQVQTLYDNALIEANRLQLQVGQALTLAQQNSLTRDIIWLEYTDLNGESLLVPRLYSPRTGKTRYITVIDGEVVIIDGDTENTGLIAGETIILEGDTDNTGDIDATLIQLLNGHYRGSGVITGDTVRMALASIRNQGHIQAATLAIDSTGTLANTGNLSANQVDLTAETLTNTGSIAGDTVAITSTGDSLNTGQITGIRSVVLDATGTIRNGVSTRETSDGVSRHTQLASAGAIAAGHVRLTADGKVVTTGGTLTGDTVALTGKQGVDLSAVTHTHSTAHATRTSHTGTVIQAGRLEIDSDNAVTSTASDIDIMGDASITGDTIALTAITHEGQFKDLRQTAVSQGSTQIGGDLTMTATDTLAIRGDVLETTGNAVITADTITIAAAQTGQSQDTGNYSMRETTQVKAGIRSGGDLAVSGRRISILASDLAADAITLTATDDITLANQDATHYSRLTDISRGHWGAKTTKTTTVSATDTVKSAVSGNTITLSSDALAIQGSDLTSTGDMRLNARDISIKNSWDRQQKTIQKSETGSFHASGQDHAAGMASETGVGSTLTAGGTLAMTAQSNLAIQGSDITATILDAQAPEITIHSAQNTASRYSHKHQHGIGHKKIIKDDALRITQASSTVLAQDNLRLSGEAIAIAGSNLTATGDMTLAADTVAITGTEERDYARSYTLTQSLDSASMRITDAEQVEASVRYSQQSRDITHDNRTITSSTLASGGTLSITATDAIALTGSDLTATDIALTASDIAIASAVETTRHQETEEMLALDIGMTLGNAYIDSINRVSVLDDANQQLHQAKKELDRIQDLYDAGQSRNSALDMAKANYTLAIANVAAATASMSKQAARAARSAGTYGLYGEQVARTSGSISTYESDTITQKASQISGQTVSITSGATLGIAGSDILGTESVMLDARTVNIQATQNTERTHISNQQVTGSIQGGKTAMQSDSYLDTHTLTHRHATVSGGTLMITSADDIRVSGATIYGDTVAIQTGALSLASVVDRTYSDSSSQSMSAGTGGYSGSRGYAGRHAEQVGQLSGITGNTVQIAATTIDLDGAEITSTTDNLTVRADTLVARDLALTTASTRFNARVTTRTAGGQVSRRVAGNQGETVFTWGYGSYDRDDLVRSTIGMGDVLVTGTGLGAINRDRALAYTPVREIDGGQFDSSLRVDHRWASEDGRQQLEQEFLYLPKNLKQAGKNAYRDSLNAIDAVQENAAGRGQDGVWHDYQGKRRNLQAVSNQEAVADALAQLDQTDASQRALTGILDSLVTDAIAQVAPDHAVAVALYRDFESGETGFYDRDSQTVYVNLAYQDGSTRQLMTVLGDEMSHVVDHALGRPSGYSHLNRQRISTQYGNNAAMQSVWYGDSASEYSVFQSKLGRIQDDSFGTQNAQASRVSERETRLFLYNDTVVATDGVADSLVVDLSKVGYDKLTRAGYTGDVFTVDTGFSADGRLYNLNNDKEFAILMSQTDINYDFTGNERIYYQNGMNNNLDDALAGRALLNTFFPNENVGLIHNKTGGLMDDVAEYLPNGLAKKDVVLAHMYTKLSEKSGDNLVVTFSAGNEDIKKAMRVMALDGRSANHKISVISAGSPVGLKALQKAAEPVGITIRSQHNTLKDPITWGPAGMIGAAAVASVPVGVYTAAKVFPLALATGPYAIPISIAYAGATVVATGVATGATVIATGGAEALGIHRYHSFDKYLDRNDGGFRDEIMQWGVDNGLEVYLPASYHESKQPLFRTPDKVGSWKNALGRVSTL